MVVAPFVTRGHQSVLGVRDVSDADVGQMRAGGTAGTRALQGKRSSRALRSPVEVSDVERRLGACSMVSAAPQCVASQIGTNPRNGWYPGG